MWVEMIQLYADAERSVQPGQRAQFPNETAEKLIKDGAAVQVDGPQGERTEIRTRPVPQPPKAQTRKAPAKKADGSAAGPATPPVDPSAPKE